MRDEHTKDASQAKNYQPIEDYGMIGDLHTVALVGKNGSIDWACIPAFDSPSVFGALLDAKKGGRFQISPQETSGIDRKQYYLADTNILVTRFFLPQGVGEVTDFMPIQKDIHTTYRHRIVRAVHVVRDTLRFEMTCQPAFNYARDSHIVHRTEQGVLFRSPQLTLGLFSTVPLIEDGRGGVHATFTLQEDQWAYFLLESADDRDIKPAYHSLSEYQEALLTTQTYWRHWLQQCCYRGRWREMVNRSALTLKLLTYAPTGAIVAAPTTSLPEGIGGERNWDYRFTWLRDAALTLQSLLLLGFTEEANAFGSWMLSSYQQGEVSVQPMYTIHGARDMPEEILDHLEGYRRSQPVRIGNGASKQQQLDVYGEFLDSLYAFLHHRGMHYTGWLRLLHTLNWLGKNWQTPDEGIWEVRGGARSFVHSRVMCWVAFDRALRIAHDQSLPAPIEEWTHIRDQIYQEIMEHGWSEKKQSFVQYYGSDAIDASALLISLTGFSAPTDPRMMHTIDRIQKELMHKPLVYRYRNASAADDGLQGREGSFSICSFWLVEALTRAGRFDEARENLEQMFTYANHLGLYAEEVGPLGEALGNFPQAFTHLALIRACYYLDQALM